MVRMARSQTNFAAPNKGLAQVKTQTFNESVPQFQSKGAGLDPFRGDMTNSFTNFFGSVNETIGSVEGYYKDRASEDATEYANDMKARAATEATDYHMQNPTSTDVTTALETEDVGLSSNRHFVNTYKQTLGSNIGSRLYSDFTASQASANPANFEENALAYWDENYSGGTEDPLVDLAMQTAWSRNYENNRISASQETIRRQRAAARLEHNRSIYRSLADGVSVESLNRTMGSGVARPGESIGQLTAGNFGVLMEAVSNGNLSSNEIGAIQSWIDHVPNSRPDGTGSNGQSIADRFPILAARASLQLPAIRARNATLAGQEATTDITTEFFEGMGELDDPVDQMRYLNEHGPSMVEELRNTRGVTSRAVADFRSTVNSRRAGMMEYVQARNAVSAIGAGGEIPFGTDVTGQAFQTAILDEVSSANSAIERGDTVGNLVRTYGADVIPKAVVNSLSSDLTYGDPEARSRAARTILQASGTGQVFDRATQDALTDENSALRMSVIRSFMDQGVPDESAITASMTTDAAIQAFQEADRPDLYSIEGTATEQEETMRGFFSSDEMLTELETFVEGKNGFSRAFSNQNGGSMTAQAERALNRAGDAFIIRQDTLGRPAPTQEEIRQHVAETAIDKMYLENGVWNYDPSATNSANDGTIRLGTNIYNPQTGDSENTIETQNFDVETIRDALPFLLLDGDLSTIPDPDALLTNGKMILMDGMPLDLQVGVPIGTDQEYDPDGQRQSWFADAWDPTSVTLTGDPEEDLVALQPYFGPGITLRANRNLDGIITSYGLVVSPRYMNEPTTDVEELSTQDRDAPRPNFSIFGAMPAPSQ